MKNENEVIRKLNDSTDALRKLICLVEAVQYLTASDKETETQLEIIDRIYDLATRTLEAVR